MPVYMILKKKYYLVHGCGETQVGEKPQINFLRQIFCVAKNYWMICQNEKEKKSFKLLSTSSTVKLYSISDQIKISYLPR